MKSLIDELAYLRMEVDHLQLVIANRDAALEVWKEEYSRLLAKNSIGEQHITT